MESKRSSLRVLMKRIKTLSGHGEFDKVQDLLVECDDNMRIEMENLRRDGELRIQDLLELENLQNQQNLEILVKDQELKENALRSLIEKEIECANQIKEKNEEISGINRKLGDQLLESNKLVEVQLEKISCLNTKVKEYDETVEKLRQQVMASDIQKKKSEDIIQDLKNDKLKLNKELKQCKFLASITIKELDRQKLEELKLNLSATNLDKKRSNETHAEMVLKCLESSKTIEDLNRQLLEVGKEKTNSEEILHEMKSEMGRATKMFRKAKMVDVRAIKEMKRQQLDASETVEELRKQLLEADIKKKKSDETIKEMMEASHTIELKRKHSETTEASYAMEFKVDWLHAKMHQMKIEIKKLNSQIMAAKTNDIIVISESDDDEKDHSSRKQKNCENAIAKINQMPSPSKSGLKRKWALPGKEDGSNPGQNKKQSRIEDKGESCCPI